MYWLIGVAALVLFRKQLAGFLAPYMATIPPNRLAFFGNLTTLVSAALYILPFEFVGLGVLKRPSYLLSLWSVVVTLAWSIYSNHGSPPLPENFSFSNWRESLASMQMRLQPWLQKALLGVDFHFLFFALIFVSAHPSVFALAILCRRALWSVCTHAGKEMAENPLWKRFAPVWAGLKAKEAEILHWSVMMEILLGFWLVVSLLLPTRQFLTLILYVNFLKTRYQVPRSQAMHAKAWAQIGKTIEPAVKALPILQKPIDMGKAWFKPPGAP